MAEVMMPFLNQKPFQNTGLPRPVGWDTYESNPYAEGGRLFGHYTPASTIMQQPQRMGGGKNPFRGLFGGRRGRRMGRRQNNPFSPNSFRSPFLQGIGAQLQQGNFGGESPFNINIPNVDPRAYDLLLGPVDARAGDDDALNSMFSNRIHQQQMRAGNQLQNFENINRARQMLQLGNLGSGAQQGLLGLGVDQNAFNLNQRAGMNQAATQLLLSLLGGFGG